MKRIIRVTLAILFALVMTFGLKVSTASAQVPNLKNDPNCNVNLTDKGPIKNYYQPMQNMRKDASNVIAKLNYADIYRLPPFRLTEKTVRLDVQGKYGDNGRNWQVQVNNMSGNSTIAHANIAGSLESASTIDRQRLVERKFRDALVKSLDSEHSQLLEGNCK
ncbi:MAG: hypothetical protein HC899_23060 [Leptolyngbyaceae cyanobacterium SM1_4_3]|nr:hypothetical protein [Microcoleus sp. SU_5_3]NJL39307.1 hypothetical protein [Leptolyngbyaceae cyanobacterium SM1_4_3]